MGEASQPQPEPELAPLFAAARATHIGAASASTTPSVSAPTTLDQPSHLGALEREAFAKGYAQGERAGHEAGAKRAEATLRRLTLTLEELSRLRKSVIRETEQQMVQLALTLARRVVKREVTLDPDLVGAMAHVALDRLGQDSPATIRLNPDDYAAVVASRGEGWAGSHVTVVADAAIARGGCLVESDFGMVDASVDAQIDELSRALLGDRPAEEPVVVPRGD